METRETLSFHFSAVKAEWFWLRITLTLASWRAIRKPLKLTQLSNALCSEGSNVCLWRWHLSTWFDLNKAPQTRARLCGSVKRFGPVKQAGARSPEHTLCGDQNHHPLSRSSELEPEIYKGQTETGWFFLFFKWFPFLKQRGFFFFFLLTAFFSSQEKEMMNATVTPVGVATWRKLDSTQEPSGYEE